MYKLVVVYCTECVIINVQATNTRSFAMHYKDESGSQMMTNTLVPVVVEQTARGERSYDLFSRLMKDRILFLTGQVNDNMSDVLVAQLLFLENEDSGKPINMYINSPGGSVTAGLAIYNTMQLIRAPVHTYVIGQAASMGSFLAQAGEPGHRFVLPESRTMIHRVSGGFSGFGGNTYHAADAIKEAARTVEEMERLNTRLTTLYAKHNSKGKTVEDLADAMRFDTFLSAYEAVEYGLADQVLEQLDAK